MSEANQNRGSSWRVVAVITAVGFLLSLAVAWTGYEWLATVDAGQKT